MSTTSSLTPPIGKGKEEVSPKPSAPKKPNLKKPVQKKPAENQTGSLKKSTSKKAGAKNIVKSATPAEVPEDKQVFLGGEQQVVTTSPNAKSPKKKLTAKKIAGATLMALAAGAVVITPAVVYYKNKEYEIVVESEVDNFTAYTLTVKRGATISMLKKQLNVFEGHNLVGIFKDPECTIPFSDSDKVTKNTNVYLKYEKLTFTVKIPTVAENNAYSITFSDTYDLNAVEWGTEFSFAIKLNYGYEQSDIQVLVNGVAIEPSTIWEESNELVYITSPVAEDLNIDIMGVSINTYSLTLPSSEDYSIEYDGQIDLTNLEHGSEFKFKVNLNEQFSNSSLIVKANQNVIEKDSAGYYVVDSIEEDIQITVENITTNSYVVTLPELNGFTVSCNQTETVLWGESFEFSIELDEAYSQSVLTVLVNGNELQKNSSGKYVVENVYQNTTIQIEGVRINTYEVRWLDENGSVLEIDDVKHFEVPTYDGVIPTKSSDYQFDYEFAGWDKEIEETTSNVVYRATYSKTEKDSISLANFSSSVIIQVTRNNKVQTLKRTDSVYQGEVLRISYAETDGKVMSEFSVNNEVITLKNDEVVEVVVGNELNITYSEVDACGLTFELNSNKASYAVTSYDGSVSNVIIPSKVYNNPVTILKTGTSANTNGVFRNSTEITTVRIPNTITNNLSYVFYGCSSLTSVVFENGSEIINLGSSVFYGCSSLTRVVFGEDAKLETIGSYVFGKTGLVEIEIPKTVSIINSYAFRDSASLEKVTFEAGSHLGEIGTGAFYGCSNLNSVVIPSDVVGIGNNAFAGCSNLTSVTIESAEIYNLLLNKTNTSAGGLIANAQEVRVLKTIDDGSNIFLNGHEYLKSEDGDWYVYVSAETYSLSKIASNVVIKAIRYGKEETLTSKDVVYEQEKVTVSYIETDGFVMSEFVVNGEEVKNLKQVDVDSGFAVKYSEVDACGLSFTINSDETRYVVSSYDGSEPNVVVPSKVYNLPVTTIGASAFSEDLKLTSIYIPNTIETIGANAFKSCSNLNSVEFAEDSVLTTIEAHAFNNCINLSSITIPDSVILIGESAFSTMEKLTEITIPAGVKVLPSGVFDECVKLEKVVFAEGCELESVGVIAFHNCVSLTNITIPSGVTSIANDAFSGCSNLSNVTIESVEILKDVIGRDTDNAGGLIANAQEVRVIKSTDDGSNEFLNGHEYIKSEDGDYYAYTLAEIYSLSGLSANVLVKATRYGIEQTLTSSDVVYEQEQLTISYVETDGHVMQEFIVNGEAVKESAEIIMNDEFEISYSEVDACGLSFTINDDETGYVVTSYDGSESNVIIPSKVYNLPVVDVMWGFEDANGIFEQYPEKVETLYFPGTIETIKRLHSSQEQDGFALYNLKEVTFGEGVKHLYETFLCCYNSKVVVNLPNTLETIGRSAFSYADITEIEIPESVKVIGDYAFSGTKITSIRLPAKLQSIGLYAFSSCHISEIEIPDGVELVDNGLRLFSHCENLTSVKLPSSLTVIGENMFYDCLSLEEITLPESVVELSAFAFDHCESLNRINLSSQLKTVGYGAFSGCSSLTSITIPENVETIAGKAFEGCLSLSTVTIESKHVWREALGKGSNHAGGLIAYAKHVYVPSRIVNDRNYENSYLTGYYHSDDGEYCEFFVGTYRLNVVTNNSASLSITTIRSGSQINLTNGSYLYDGEVVKISYLEQTGYKMSIFKVLNNPCTLNSGEYVEVKLAGPLNDGYLNVEYSEVSTYGVTYTDYSNHVAVSAYDNSKTSVVICNTIHNLPVTTIDAEVFQDATMTSVTLPSTLTTIGDFAFNGADITSLSIPLSVTSIGKLAFANIAITSLYVPKSIKSYGYDSFHKCLKLKEVVFEEGCTAMGDNMFEGCWNITSVTLPTTMKSIANIAFSGCDNLTNIVIPNSVESIGTYAFAGSGLTSITIPSKVKTIGKNAFASTQISSVVIPDSVTSVGDSAFANCVNLKTVSLPNGNVSYGESVFYGSTALETITLPASFTTVTKQMFYGCSSLRSVTINGKLTSIGELAFQNCTSLTSFELQDTITSIGYAAFWNAGLTSITIPLKIKSWGEAVFGSCQALKDVSFTVSGYQDELNDTIRYRMFDGCTALKNIEIPTYIKVIEGNAFNRCSSLTEITIPYSIRTIGDYAFSGCEFYQVYLNSSTIYESIVDFSSAGGLFRNARYVDIPTNVYTGKVLFFKVEYRVELLGGRYQLEKLYA